MSLRIALAAAFPPGDQLQKRLGVMMTLTARAATERLAAGSIGGGDAGEDHERRRRTGLDE
jgi:hypothetical protein